jgi:rhodanese-related sulfurtransferase
MPSTSRTVWRGGTKQVWQRAPVGSEPSGRGRVTVERVDRNEVLRLLDEADAQLVDVRSAEQYGRAHLPGATNLPLVHVIEGVDQLDPTRPVIVYCSDARSDTSARAAARLEDLGFSPIYRYASGAADWRAAGLPVEGREGALGRAGTVARRDVPTARSAESVGDVADRVGPYRTEPVVVVDDDGVVLGLLPGATLANRTAVVGDMLEDLPATVRADEPLHELAALMVKRDLTSVLVTDPDGRLLGLARRDDVERLEHPE